MCKDIANMLDSCLFRDFTTNTPRASKYLHLGWYIRGQEWTLTTWMQAKIAFKFIKYPKFSYIFSKCKLSIYVVRGMPTSIAMTIKLITREVVYTNDEQTSTNRKHPGDN